MTKQCSYLLPLGCPNITVTPSFNAELLLNTTLTCSSTGGLPSPSYYWLDGTNMASDNATITVSEAGPFLLTCVANSSHEGDHCVKSVNVSGIAVLRAFSSLRFVFFILFFILFIYFIILFAFLYLYFLLCVLFNYLQTHETT